MISEYERYCILKEELEYTELLLKDEHCRADFAHLAEQRDSLNLQVGRLRTKLVKEAKNER